MRYFLLDPPLIPGLIFKNEDSVYQSVPGCTSWTFPRREGSSESPSRHCWIEKTSFKDDLADCDWSAVKIRCFLLVLANERLEKQSFWLVSNEEKMFLLVLAKEYIEKQSFWLVSNEEKRFLIGPRIGIPKETKPLIGPRNWIPGEAHHAAGVEKIRIELRLVHPYSHWGRWNIC